MPRGEKRAGGRPKGSKNRKTVLLEEKARAAGVDPLDVMLLVMNKYVEEQKWDRAAAVAKDAAPYLHSRRATVAVTGRDGSPLAVRLTVEQLVTADRDLEGWERARANADGD